MARVLIIGGTGMLRPVIHELVDRGDSVFAVARRPHRAAPARHETTGFVPVVGQWGRPADFVDQVESILRSRGEPGGLDGAIAWIHAPHRQRVLSELDRVLAEEATLVQLWGSASHDPRRVMADESVVEHPWTMRHVFLGYHAGPGGTRWLSDTEISAATLRAWDGDADVVAGSIDPWEHRP